MTIDIGGHIGPYEIVAPLGAGGMGEVYRARDAKLNRDVAIKVLPEVFSLDPDRLTRFRREAQVLASLNHPNIGHIYGLEDASGVQALVLELVEGPTLADRIAQGPIPLDEALPIAQQIADALESAHEHGIIHRDLKPANIKLRPDGTVKVLDFGLAKALDPVTGSSTDAVTSPTLTARGTQLGVIVGTAAYMAPEQARGHDVDRRADIWSFGVVLFEMLSGSQAFRGETISDVLASVLKNDLDWSVLPSSVPAPVKSLLRRCLNPDRKNRLRDIGEARIAIADYLANPTSAATPPGAKRTNGASRPWQVASGALGIALLGLLVWVGIPRAATPGPSMRIIVAPPPGVSARVAIRPSISMSPDGWTLAFVGIEAGMPSVYLRDREDFDARKLPGTEGATNPVFSPDGRRIAFSAGTDLKVTSLAGGVIVVGKVNDPRGISWIDNETFVFTPEAIGGMREMSLASGAPRALTTLDEKAGERTHRWPHVLPGGEWVLFTVGTLSTPDTYDDARIDAVNRRTGERRIVFQGAATARYAPTGHLVLAKGGSLFAVAFDPATLKTSGTPVGLLQGVGADLTTGAAHIDWSPSGTFAYVPGDTRGVLRHLVWSDLKGARQPSPLSPSLINDARLSPDGKRVAVVAGTTGLADIWVHDFDRGTATRLTFTAINGSPIWSHDGRDIYYSAIDPARGTTVFRTSADGGREPVEVTRVNARTYLKGLGPDESWVIVDYVNNARASIGRLALKAGARIEPIVDTPADEFAGALSPDGRFVAYQSDGDGLPQIYVRDVNAPSGRWQVSSAGGEEPMWSPAGDAMYYRFENLLMRAPVQTTGSFQSGRPALLFDGVFNLRSDTGVSYEPHPDGKRLLMTRPADATDGGTIRLVTQWFDTLKAIK